MKKNTLKKLLSKVHLICIGIVVLSCENRSMFEIKERSFGAFTEFVLMNNSTGEYVSAIPAFGATLNQIALKKDTSLVELLEGSPTFEVLMNDGKNKFYGSKLFPFPNRIKDGKYNFEGKDYQLGLNFPQENNAIHGLVLTEKFEVLEKIVQADKVVLRLLYTFDRKNPGYPFLAQLKITYELTSAGFTCTTDILNNDTTSIPIGEGWHPYFKTGTKVDDLLLKLPIEQTYMVDERMIPTLSIEGVNGYDNGKKIQNDKFDTGFKVSTKDSIARTEIVDPLKKLKIVIWQEAGIDKYRYLQVYTPPGRQSIAIEPMTCLADAFNNKQGLIVLEPKESKSFTFGVQLE